MASTLVSTPSESTSTCSGQCGLSFHPGDLSICDYCGAGFCKHCDPDCRCQRAISAAQWLIDNGIIETHALIG